MYKSSALLEVVLLNFEYENRNGHNRIVQILVESQILRLVQNDKIRSVMVINNGFMKRPS